MDTIFVNSKNNYINLKRTEKYVALSNLSIYYAWKNIKRHAPIIYLKY